jgi:hypothetical protein
MLADDTIEEGPGFSDVGGYAYASFFFDFFPYRSPLIPINVNTHLYLSPSIFHSVIVFVSHVRTVSFEIPEFHKVFANAGGLYVEVELNANPEYESTGLDRIHFGPHWDGLVRVLRRLFSGFVELRYLVEKYLNISLCLALCERSFCTLSGYLCRIQFSQTGPSASSAEINGSRGIISFPNIFVLSPFFFAIFLLHMRFSGSGHRVGQRRSRAEPRSVWVRSAALCKCYVSVCAGILN